jgi:hypothetical protein
MKIPHPIVIATLTLASSLGAKGQNTVVDYVSNETAAAQRQREIEDFPYNLKVGQLKLDLSQTIGIEYNDNVRYSDSHREEDGIIRPVFNIGALYPVSQLNTLRFTCGVGYEKFFQYDSYDRWVVTPNSALDFDLYLGSYRINFHDRFSYEMDPGRLAAISGLARYGGFDNTLGASIQGTFTRTVAEFGYDFEKFISSQSEFDYVNRSTHSVLLRGGYIVAPELVAGLESKVSPTYYDENLVNDNVGYNAGAYANWKIGEVFSVEPRVGYSYYTFSDGRLYQNISDMDAVYFGLKLKHQFRPRFGYTIDAGRDLQNGPYGSIEDLYHVSLNSSLNVIYKIFMDTGVTYESGTDKYGTFADDFNRWIFSIGASRRLSDKFTLRLDYRFMLKDSAYNDRDYRQNLVTLNLNYRF